MGPCGNTAVSDAELAEARRLFNQQVPAVTSGLSIVQQLAVDASTVTKTIGKVGGGGGTVVPINSAVGDSGRERVGLSPTTSMSRKVVNSHLQYFHRYPAFRLGDFSKDTLYGFLFFAVVENHLRMGYARRVLRNLLSYARRYLSEHSAGGDGGGNRLLVPLEGAGGRSSTLEIRLTPGGVAFFRDNPRGIVVQTKRFYQLMNSVGNQTNNERLKNVVCEARRPRELVFSDDQNASLLRFVSRALNVLTDKYSNSNRFVNWTTASFRSSATDGGQATRIESAVRMFVSSDTAANTDRRQVTAERTVFEYCVAFLLGFLSGARIKSTLMRLTVCEFESLRRGKTLEKFTKGSFTRVFIPAQFTDNYSTDTLLRNRRTDNSSGELLQRWRVYDDPSIVSDGTSEPTDRLLYNVALTRRNRYLYGGVKTDQDLFFLSSGRRLDYAFDRIYATLFARPRPKGVLWHAQRRRYLGSVNERYGAVIASKSVGHADVETTMMYINNSMHGEDTNRRAGTAIYEETLRLMGRVRGGSEKVSSSSDSHVGPLTLKM